MSRQIYGTILNVGSGSESVAGLRVQAWDEDPGADDFMGETYTDANGNYSLSYSDGHWDPSISHKVTVWRPDIYVTVGKKSPHGHWVNLQRSSVHSNHKLRDDLRINLDVNLEPPISRMTGFKPEVHGFLFRNSFTVKPDILGIDLGTWNIGLCGGMCAAALHCYNTSTSIPQTTQIPQQGSALFDELMRRQIATLSLDVVTQIYDWQSAPDEGHWNRKHSVGHRTKSEWWKLKASLDAGWPTNLVLIRVEGYLSNPTDNHQVLAIGYTYDPTTKHLDIYDYDPNDPQKTNTLSMNLGLPDSRLDARDSIGSRLRGFFVNPLGERASNGVSGSSTPGGGSTGSGGFGGSDADKPPLHER